MFDDDRLINQNVRVWGSVYGGVEGCWWMTKSRAINDCRSLIQKNTAIIKYTCKVMPTRELSLESVS